MWTRKSSEKAEGWASGCHFVVGEDAWRGRRQLSTLVWLFLDGNRDTTTAVTMPADLEGLHVGPGQVRRLLLLHPGVFVVCSNVHWPQKIRFRKLSGSSNAARVASMNCARL